MTDPTPTEALEEMLFEASKDSQPFIADMVPKEQFLKFVELAMEARKNDELAWDAGVDTTAYASTYAEMVKCMLHLAFTKAQVDWIEWWLYEDVDKVVSFTDGAPSIRLDTAEQLWDFLQTVDHD